MPSSNSLFSAAKKRIPGGVNSPVRAFGAVGGTPPFVASGRGSRIKDVDGREYIDYVMSWGPLILGHAHPAVVRAVRDAAGRGTSFGAPTPGEVELAQSLCDASKPLQRVRLVSSGTEAAMSALRVARALSKRTGVVKFAGCYHGHADAFLVKAGSGLATFGISSSAGVPNEIARKTFVLPYNDPAALRELLWKRRQEIGAVILEPVAGNMGLVLPSQEFLEKIQQYCRELGVILICDEVITGFRLRYGTVSETLGLKPDLLVLGKIIGGGMPLAAFGGSAAAMSLVSPEGPVYQAGTLSGNPVAVAAGRAALNLLRRTPRIYESINSKAQELQHGLERSARQHNLQITINRAGSMLTLFFHPGPVTDYAGAAKSDVKRYGRFFHEMLRRGVYLPPSQFEAWFVSAAHSDKDIDKTLQAADGAFRRL
jgi:glutamate-1-semialdehyde 2,1-aminomutase